MVFSPSDCNYQPKYTLKNKPSLILLFIRVPTLTCQHAYHEEVCYRKTLQLTTLCVIICPHLQLLQFSIDVHIKVWIHRQEMISQHTKPAGGTEVNMLIQFNSKPWSTGQTGSGNVTLKAGCQQLSCVYHSHVLPPGGRRGFRHHNYWSNAL